jgi:hypothetical protein
MRTRYLCSFKTVLFNYCVFKALYYLIKFLIIGFFETRARTCEYKRDDKKEIDKVILKK